MVSKYLAYAFRPANEVYAHRLVVFAFDDMAHFAWLSSTVNEVWARKNSSSLETRLNYSPSDAFETFPFCDFGAAPLGARGEAYESLRASIMRREQIGLTDLYNRFHDPACTDAPIAELRDLHRQIDEAALAAYGWSDVPLGHGFHAVPYLPENDRVRYTIAEEARLEILRRLARLNRERYQEEQAEAERQAAAAPNRPKRAPAKRGRPRLTVIQGDLF
ncbi:MAG: hypothetical protein MUF66_16180 [Gammaproteobacteria bacterium]|nr:hypothetical protein [Gammaproteobacteria bacterium]